MKSCLWGIVFASACLTQLALADEVQSQPAQDDLKKVEGTWQIDELIVNGTKIEFDDLKKFAVVNSADGSWSLQLSGSEVSHGTSTYDQAKQPKEIDFVAMNDEKEETKFVGIYELAENTRKVCYTSADNPRPKDFESTIDNQCVLVTFSRVKAE